MSLLRQTMTPLSTREHDRLDSALAIVNRHLTALKDAYQDCEKLPILCDEIDAETMAAGERIDAGIYDLQCAKDKLESLLGQDEAASIDYERAVYSAGRV